MYICFLVSCIFFVQSILSKTFRHSMLDIIYKQPMRIFPGWSDGGYNGLLYWNFFERIVKSHNALENFCAAASNISMTWKSELTVYSQLP